MTIPTFHMHFSCGFCGAQVVAGFAGVAAGILGFKVSDLQGRHALLVGQTVTHILNYLLALLQPAITQMNKYIISKFCYLK
jgi:hypothetical protein